MHQEYHDFEEVCTLCAIPPAEVPGAPDCPIVDCTDSVMGNAVFDLLQANCFDDSCTTNPEPIGDMGMTCAELFFYIKCKLRGGKI